MTDEQLDHLRNDPDVVMHRRDGPPRPFVSGIRVTRPVDPLELIGRRDEDAAE